MLNPNQFRVNEVWLAIRVNEAFLLVKDEPYDIYVLMDAASTYVFGQVLSRAVNETPSEKDVEALFGKAWSAKSQWAEKLIVPEDFLAENVFRMQAEKNGLAFSSVPLSDLDPIISPLRASFAADFG